MMTKQKAKKDVDKKLLLDVLRPLANAEPKPKKDDTTVKLTGNGANGVKKIAFSEIRKKKRDIWKMTDDVVVWNNRHFAIFVRQQYMSRYSEDWGLSLIGVTNYMTQIKDAVSEILGFCDNFALYDYIIYFFTDWYEHISINHSGFWVQSLKQRIAINSFCEQYDYKHRVAKRGPVKPISTPKKSWSRIKDAYLLGPDVMLVTYGLILPVNWMIQECNTGQDEAVSYLTKALKNFRKNGQISKVMSVTESLSPYPESFACKSTEEILQASIGENIYCSIAYSTDSEWEVENRI